MVANILFNALLGFAETDVYRHRRAEGVRIRYIMEDGSLEGACLLCSEETPEHCHRRLVAEYLHEKWQPIEIMHL